MDSIDRQDAIDVIRTTVAEGMLADTLELRLNELPSAEKTGKWIDVTKCGGCFLWKCSECGDEYLEDTDYCPSCGSRMENES